MAAARIDIEKIKTLTPPEVILGGALTRRNANRDFMMRRVAGL
jgi:hypothetical protein